MSENISALMDGELDAREQQGVHPELLRDGEALRSWRAYHLIGDTLRGAPHLSAGFSARLAARLDGEPNVLAPRAAHAAAPRRWRPLQVAAGIAAVALVGWVALAPPGGIPQRAEVARAPALTAPATPAPAAQLAELPAPHVPLPGAAADYLLAHQAYSPRGNLQGVAPYVRTVSESVRHK